MADDNPAAVIYAATLADAAAVAAGPPPVATDDLLTITGTLGGPSPEDTAEVRTMMASGAPSSSVTIGPSIDLRGLARLVVIGLIVSWIGHALFSGRGK